MPDHTASFESAFELRIPPAQPPPYTPQPPPSNPFPGTHSYFTSYAPGAPAAFGNKLAVLGGDFLLGRNSAALSRLRSHEVVELIASVIANLVKGEILQMKGSGTEAAPHPSSSATSAIDLKDIRTSPSPSPSDKWAIYHEKRVRAAVVLGGCREGEVWKEVAYAYGRNLGIAFQTTDTLDFSSSTAQLGKPGFADLRLGLATGPALYAAEEIPELEDMIERRFGKDGDVERSLTLISSSNDVERARELARVHAEKVREELTLLPRSEARDALEALTEGVVKRR
ncbi:terpenoid synthase [Suillus hirtellus]|nr:terpenoid synthase [Suillus hirtellus]